MGLSTQVLLCTRQFECSDGVLRLTCLPLPLCLHFCPALLAAPGEQPLNQLLEPDADTCNVRSEAAVSVAEQPVSNIQFGAGGLNYTATACGHSLTRHGGGMQSPEGNADFPEVLYASSTSLPPVFVKPCCCRWYDLGGSAASAITVCLSCKQLLAWGTNDHR